MVASSLTLPVLVRRAVGADPEHRNAAVLHAGDEEVGVAVDHRGRKAGGAVELQGRIVGDVEDRGHGAVGEQPEDADAVVDAARDEDIGEAADIGGRDRIRAVELESAAIGMIVGVVTRKVMASSLRLRRSYFATVCKQARRPAPGPFATKFRARNLGLFYPPRPCDGRALDFPPPDHGTAARRG